MQAIHHLGVLSTRKDVDKNAGFMLTNKKGSYCCFFNRQDSKYNGLFMFDETSMSMYKFIENIEISGSGTVSILRNGFYFAERAKGNITESYFMPKELHSLIYELSCENEIDVAMDCRESYDNRQFGRYYEISEEEGCILIKFTKKTDRKEDDSDGKEEFSLHLAVKSDTNSYKKNGLWIERHYPMDAQRNSPPYTRHVYNALKLKGSKFVFSMSKRKSDAIRECNHIFSSMHDLKNKEKENFFEFLKNSRVKDVISNKRLSSELKVAYVGCANSLNNLKIGSKKGFGVLAGLPWFFQFWARDSLVSLKAVSMLDYSFSKKLIQDYFKKIDSNGRLINFHGEPKNEGLGSADAAGWLFVRCNEIIGKINKNKAIISSIRKSVALINKISHSSSKVKEYIKKCNAAISRKENECHKLAYEIESALEKSLQGLLKHHTKDGFEFNEPKETWMDTGFGNDTRSGIRLEIQALRLHMYKLMFELAQSHKYKALENILKNRLRQKFWNGSLLADGFDDFTIRPNIFIAYYAYPELLSGKEWETCFENTLKALWLDWGGLSTIDKSNPLYTETSTGEDNRSYHRGDSWFWINNLAALCLYRVNKNKFEKNIKKIIGASTEEILWKGCIGCHAELSDAKELSSKGCFNQAWSNAMFMEMVNGISLN